MSELKRDEDMGLDKDGDRKRDGYVWAFSPVDCLFSSCAFMFQGPAGTKGDKGERVSLSTVLQLFRANPVLLVLFCCGNTVIFAEVKLLTITHKYLPPLLWRNRSAPQHAVTISCSSFCTNIHCIPLALPQPRLRRTKSNQCSWSKFAAVQGLYFCWHGREAVTAEGLRDTQLASLNRTCNSCFCFILSNCWGHLYPAAVNFSTTWHERLGKNVREDFFLTVYLGEVAQLWW